MDFSELNRKIVGCRRCPRLVEWRERVGREKRKSYESEDYWAKPVPCFGDPNATRLIVGLAPAAHGGNRTGRIFTGDRSGDWLFGSLYRCGAANQPHSVGLEDGLELKDVFITAVIHCAPPDNKPLPSEILNCREYLLSVFELRPWKSVLCLGNIAWTQTLRQYEVRPIPKFGHGAVARKDDLIFHASYHPSQQNTFTGKLTEGMLDTVMKAFLSA